MLQLSSIFANRFSLGPPEHNEADSVSSVVQDIKIVQEGSEKPTLKNGLEDGFKKRTKPDDFLRFRTFLVSSDNIFLGNGAVISWEGQKSLADLSSFLIEFPKQMIILSESGPETTKGSEDIGFQRAWEVFEYLTREKGIERSRFSLSATGTASLEYHMRGVRQDANHSSGRILEIVLLDRSI